MGEVQVVEEEMNVMAGTRGRGVTSLLFTHLIQIRLKQHPLIFFLEQVSLLYLLGRKGGGSKVLSPLFLNKELKIDIPKSNLRWENCSPLRMQSAHAKLRCCE